jgi:hypothetical protein
VAGVKLVIRDALGPHAVKWTGGTWWCATCQQGFPDRVMQRQHGYCPGEAWSLPWPG